MNIIVTGGTDGIGLALVKNLLSLNHNVKMVGKDPKKAERILDTLNNSKLEFYRCDLSEKREINKLIKKINNLNSIDFLFNNSVEIFYKSELNSE